MTVVAGRPAGTASGPRELDGEGIGAVEAVLHERIGQHAATLAQVSGDLEAVARVIGEAATAGKRLRAAFCLWGARAAADGGSVVGAVEAAAALELFHLAALVHDDLMDRSDERRGLPTVHRRFSDEHLTSGRLGDSDHHGAAVAVLAGDLLLTWSDDLLAESVARAPAARSTAVRAEWTQMRDQVLAGQYLDVLGQTRASVSVEHAARVLRYKSAKYTVEHPLRLGGALAGASPELLERFTDFGLAVGEAFQLRDDVLGVFGAPAVTGKPAVDDVREGKRTLLVACAQESATPAQLELLHAHLGDPTVGEAEVAQVREVLVATGALARVEERIEQLAAAAHAELRRMRLDTPSRTALASLTDACAWRAA